MQQGFVHGSTVFATIRAKGGGGNDLLNESGNCSPNNTSDLYILYFIL